MTPDKEAVSRAWREALGVFNVSEEAMPEAEMLFLAGVASMIELVKECETIFQVVNVVSAARAEAQARIDEIEGGQHA